MHALAAVRVGRGGAVSLLQSGVAAGATPLLAPVLDRSSASSSQRWRGEQATPSENGGWCRGHSRSARAACRSVGICGLRQCCAL